jgi:hypothetical protein
MSLSKQVSIVVIFLVATLFASITYAREMRALVVGVSEYPNLDKELQLAGPRNDAVRARDVLMRRGFKSNNIKVLADGVSGAELPTRDNILAELDHLAVRAQKDDFVFLYFAGHGSQQPADRSTTEGRAEEDGLYEIFLPRDIGKWDGSVGTTKNALVKTELRDAVDRILATGAFVWGVFDSCHSATLVRGENTGVRYRYVDPTALGIPQAALDEAARDAPQSRGESIAIKPPFISTASNKDVGGSVFFYAAQTNQTTPEMILPLGQADAKDYGLFGFTVMEALETGIPMTYRQMQQYILASYGARNEKSVTPLFSGTALDQPVLFQNAPIVQQWKIEHGRNIIVQAGALANLSEGAIVAVVRDPLAKTEAAFGYLKLTKVGLAESIAVPIEYNAKPELNSAAIPEGSYARMVMSPPQYELLVSVDTKDCNSRCATKDVIAELRAAKAGVTGTSIKWVDAPATGDVRLKLLPDRILLLPPSLQGADCVKSAKTCEQASTLLINSNPNPANGSLHDKLCESLHAIARSTNLMRIAANLMNTGNVNSKLEVTTKIIKKNKEELPYTKDQVPSLHAGDQVTVSLQNKGLSAVDVTVLYVDSRYGVSVLYPRPAGASNRLTPNASKDITFTLNDKTIGVERILTIAVVAKNNLERADFSFLKQSPQIASQGIESRRGDIDPDVMAFLDAGYSDYKTRGDDPAPKAPSSRTSMQVFTLNIEH